MRSPPGTVQRFQSSDASTQTRTRVSTAALFICRKCGSSSDAQNQHVFIQRGTFSSAHAVQPVPGMWRVRLLHAVGGLPAKLEVSGKEGILPQGCSIFCCLSFQPATPSTDLRRASHLIPEPIPS